MIKHTVDCTMYILGREIINGTFYRIQVILAQRIIRIKTIKRLEVSI